MDSLAIGEFSTFSPYTFLHRRHYTWRPTADQKKASIENLPYLKSDRFIHQKVDSRNPLVFTYIRQPGYYAVFNTGPLLKAQQRYGLGLLWHPKAGTFLQSQTDNDTAAWGTKLGKNKVYEADSLEGSFRLNSVRLIPSIGNHDFVPATLSVSYPLKTKGRKLVTFKEDRIDVAVEHINVFREHLPLLLSPGDNISIVAPGKCVLKKKGVVITILFDNAAKPTLTETNLKSGAQRVVVLIIETSEKLNYSIITTSANQ